MFFAISFSGLPYLFIMYLIGYRGLWGLVQLFTIFSWHRLISALSFTFIGFSAIRNLQSITDVVRNVRERARLGK